MLEVRMLVTRFMMTMIRPIMWYVLGACDEHKIMIATFKSKCVAPLNWFIAKLVFVLTRWKASVGSLLSQAWGWFIAKVGQRKGRQRAFKPECSEFKALVCWCAEQWIIVKVDLGGRIPFHCLCLQLNRGGEVTVFETWLWRWRSRLPCFFFL